MDNFDLDIFTKMESTKIEVSTKSSSRVSELKFETCENDGELLSIIKSLVNERNLTYNDVYDKYGRQLGWNMINSARKGQISWDRFRKWMELLNMEVDILIKKKEK